MGNSQLASTSDIRPPAPPGFLKWMKENLFNNFLNTILTIILVPLTIFMLIKIGNWAFFTADWRPVYESPLLYVVGQYPREQLWRFGIGFAFFMFLLGASWGNWGGILKGISISVIIGLSILALIPIYHRELTLMMRLFLVGSAILIAAGFFLSKKGVLPQKTMIMLWIIAPAISLLLINGLPNFSLLPKVETTLWGGLMMTFLLSVGGILLSFPIGILLALGRRSTLPVVRIFCTVFIETIRGVPLVTILFMFSVILALFLPPGARIDRVIRALMAVTFFSAAYTAENVRGGLQAVPGGQLEAAKALGMNSFQSTLFIVLPQALRAVIPAIVGQFIALFKDTTLVVIIGINDFLGIGRSIINSKPEFVQLQLEVFLFIAAIYMIFSYLMSSASRRLEASLGVGVR